MGNHDVRFDVSMIIINLIIHIIFLTMIIIAPSFPAALLACWGYVLLAYIKKQVFFMSPHEEELKAQEKAMAVLLVVFMLAKFFFS